MAPAGSVTRRGVPGRLLGGGAARLGLWAAVSSLFGSNFYTSPAPINLSSMAGALILS